MSVLITFIYRYLPLCAKNGIALLPCISELSVYIQKISSVCVLLLFFFFFRKKCTCKERSHDFSRYYCFHFLVSCTCSDVVHKILLFSRNPDADKCGLLDVTSEPDESDSWGKGGVVLKQGLDVDFMIMIIGQVKETNIH